MGYVPADIGPTGMVPPGIKGMVQGGIMPGIPPDAGKEGPGAFVAGHVPGVWKKLPVATGPISGGGIKKLLPHIGHWNAWPTCDISPCKTCPWGQRKGNVMCYILHGLRTYPKTGRSLTELAGLNSVFRSVLN